MRISGKAVFAGLILLVLLPGSVIPAGIVLQYKVDRKSISIGDEVRYTVSVTCPEGTKVSPPDPAAGLGGFELKNIESSESRDRPRDSNIGLA